eukprot:280398_1
MEATKEYEETYWYLKKYESCTKKLIPLNKFWCEFAMYLLNDNNGNTYAYDDLRFLSKWVLLTTCNIHEIICCLAVLDLPFECNGVNYNYIKSKDELILKCDDCDGG